MKVLAILLMMILAGCSHSSKNKSNCSDVRGCLELGAKLTGKGYLIGNDKLDEKVTNVGQVEWTKENADYLLGEVLANAGFARLKTVDNGIYKLIAARDNRYLNFPSYSATKETNDELPPVNSADWGELTYTTKNGGYRSSEIARNLRPFLSRYGRVIDSKGSGLLIVRDNLATIHQLLPLMRKMDTPVTAAEKKQMNSSLHENARKEMMKSMEGWLEKRKKHESPR